MLRNIYVYKLTVLSRWHQYNYFINALCYICVTVARLYLNNFFIICYLHWVATEKTHFIACTLWRERSTFRLPYVALLKHFRILSGIENFVFTRRHKNAKKLLYKKKTISPSYTKARSRVDARATVQIKRRGRDDVVAGREDYVKASVALLGLRLSVIACDSLGTH